MTDFSVGSLVRARGREWVVLPESTAEEDLLVLRPLGGTEDQITGIYLPLEPVEAATFRLPDPSRDLGNHLSGQLLRDAVRLGFRSGAGPFRSLARIGIEPRPYQLVPLLMALKLDPVRLLIADDVGVGKTVEALLVARELLDRAEIRRFTVLCPPHLAEQWQRALDTQFHIDAELVLSGTVARLERRIPSGDSLFEHHPFTVVSTEYIKSKVRRHEFVRACPELVIVDEAHGCAAAGLGRAAQLRNELLSELARDADRHLILVTATPHSGKEETFRSLLALLDPAFADLPADLRGQVNRPHREHLARHLVQRRRGDLKRYLDTKTPFPQRKIAEEQYTLSPAYQRFFGRALEFCREQVLDTSLDQRHQRVRWWSALALLRSLASSPAAAAATLRNRAASADTETVEEADEVGRRSVLDLDDESVEGIDVVPGSQTEEDTEAPERRRLRRLAREVEALAGREDQKLARAIELVKAFLGDGYSPILFCRFIPTVEYVAAALRKALGKKVAVEAIAATVTADDGRAVSLPPEERQRRIRALAEHPKRVLVCTDCLSEGIDLQYWFDAVMHYDLSWNPTRHEQREGRVDRYGQERKTVRALTFYGEDNPIDGIVLQVLLRKHLAIHRQLGITVPVPMDTAAVQEAIFQGLLLRENAGARQLTMEFLEPQRREVETRWDAAVEREKASRSLFAQQSIKAEEVRHELTESRQALGDETVVERFTVTSLRALGAGLHGTETLRVDLRETPAALRDLIGAGGEITVGFRGTPTRGVERLTRTHPFVEGLASYVLESALDAEFDGSPARRASVVRTAAVDLRTTLLLLRLRFHLVTRGRDDREKPLLAEDQLLVGFRGSPERADWLPAEDLEPLLGAEPGANIPPELARNQLEGILGSLSALMPRLDQLAEERGQELLAAHRRVRQAAKQSVRALRVEPHLPADVLGVFVYLPVPGGVA
ncbi:MAG: DEAD/DEAH box helicase [bacterium]|nr:DEAD/DEAH box helicase [bacterium]